MLRGVLPVLSKIRSRSSRPLSTAAFAPLNEMRKAAGPRMTDGLHDDWLTKFKDDTRLHAAINEAHAIWRDLDAKTTYAMGEQALIGSLFSGIHHLYTEETRQPYVPLAARGPWIISTHGAVIHDNGGYGMLGYGHNPEEACDAMSVPAVMANHMTASLAHPEIVGALRGEIGRSRPECPFESFILLNSGSEANEMVIRLCDLHAGNVTGERKPHVLVLEGCFHGRTLGAALLTDTSRESYKEKKAQLITKVQDDSAGGWNYVLKTKVNDVEGLRAWFKRADDEGCFIQSMFIEGVMGEGNPGEAITPEFYTAARELTLAHNAALCVDSVQAGLRATGNLSICDYPGFETLPPPDFEVYSKAINGGQFPVSIVALSKRGASWYEHGVYGNTMTGNPRACRVVAAALKRMSPEIRLNIQEMGRYFVEQYTRMMEELPGVIIRVNGTGLLYQVKLDEKYAVTAKDTGIELLLRQRGINVIHGGTNALRFTPNFDITKAEADMQIAHVREVLLEKQAEIANS